MAGRIVIDAGHGGFDNGAQYRGRKEKDDTLTIAFAVGDILKSRGYDVIYTRTSDVYDSPVEKANMANNSNADFFLSIHRDSAQSPNLYEGVQTLIYNKSGIKYEIAKSINQNLEKVGYRNIQVAERPDLAVLRRTKMPAVLVEVGFINNDSDNRRLDRYFDETALAIADGVTDVLGLGPYADSGVEKNYKFAEATATYPEPIPLPLASASAFSPSEAAPTKPSGTPTNPDSHTLSWMHIWEDMKS